MAVTANETPCPCATMPNLRRGERVGVFYGASAPERTPEYELGVVLAPPFLDGTAAWCVIVSVRGRVRLIPAQDLEKCQ